MVGYFRKLNLPNLTVVSPDAGGVERARFFAKKMDAPLAIVDKRRTDINVTEVMNVIGDVQRPDLPDHRRHYRHRRNAGEDGGCAAGRGRGRSLCVRDASGALRAGGRAHREFAVGELIVTNTIPLREEAKQVDEDQGAFDCRPAGPAIESIHMETSVSYALQLEQA